MPLILGTNSIKDTGYDVANSLRLDDGGSEYLTRTVSSAGSNTKSTLSIWVKRGNLSLSNNTLFGWTTDGSNFYNIKFGNSSDVLDIRWRNSSTQANYTSTEVFRDVSAWYHIVVAFDTSQSTASDRIKYYINGVQGSGLSGYPPQNETVLINNNSCVVRIADSGFSNGYFDGYIAEAVHVDGQQLDPTSFGEFDADSPTIWKPIDVSGLTFGTNGFYLDFENASSLGADVSGNSNNFTVNNLTSVDQSSDSCTNNFATLNPLYHYIGGAALSEGNLKFTTSGNSSVGRGMSTIRPESGKWYVECKIIDVTRFSFGLMNGNETHSSQGGNDTNSVIFGYDGGFFMTGGFTGYLSAPSNNDIVQLALDLDNDLFWIGINDTWGNSATRTEIENGTATNSGSTDIGSQVPINTGAIGIFVEDNSGTGNNVCEINFGSPSYSISSSNSDGNGFGNFEYAPPSGYFSLCTKNLAEFG